MKILKAEDELNFQNNLTDLCEKSVDFIFKTLKRFGRASEVVMKNILLLLISEYRFKAFEKQIPVANAYAAEKKENDLLLVQKK